MVGSALNPFARASQRTVSEITELRVYPIKSCRGIVVSSSFLTSQGLDLDRRWMFADAKTKTFLTIREISEMTLIDTELVEAEDEDDDELRIGIRNTANQVSIPARPTQEWLVENTDLLPVTVWSTETDGYCYRDGVNKIFSEFFGRDVVLIYKGPQPRIVGGNGAPHLLGRTASVNFPDVMPLVRAPQGFYISILLIYRDS